MKNLISILNESNESSNFDVDTFVKLWKQLFSYDKLKNYQGKMIVVDYFKDSHNGGGIWDQISSLDMSYEDKKESHNICEKIYKALKKEA